MHTFLDAIDLPPGSTLFAQDWGGLLGLRLAAERPGQFSRVAIGNTALPAGTRESNTAGGGGRPFLSVLVVVQFVVALDASIVAVARDCQIRGATGLA